MLKVEIKSFAYAEEPILKQLSFELNKGKHLAVLGESGCGKSTLLHLVYGLLDLDEGEISWDGQPILGPRYNLIPGEDYIKLVAQEFNVMPYITAGENVATYLPRIDANKDTARVKELLDVVDLSEYEDTLVRDLSGGQKQRVAIAKSLARSPKLLLLDEPFSHIDTFRKNALRRELYGYLRANNIACITATHDSQEALAYADDLLILNNGQVEAYGGKMEVFGNLHSAHQASFFGEVNAIPSKLLEAEPKRETIYLLSHQLKLSLEPTAIEGVVTTSYFQGSHYLVNCRWRDMDLFFDHPVALEPGSQVFLTTAEEH